MLGACQGHGCGGRGEAPLTWGDGSSPRPPRSLLVRQLLSCASRARESEAPGNRVGALARIIHERKLSRAGPTFVIVLLPLELPSVLKKPKAELKIIVRPGWDRRRIFFVRLS